MKSIQWQLLAAGLAGISTLLLIGSLFAPIQHNLALYTVASSIIIFCLITVSQLIKLNIRKQLDLLAPAIQKLTEGNFAVRLPIPNKSDEITKLASSFNQLAEHLEKRTARLEELDNLKSEFVSSVSHELRTPLTTIKALTRLLLREGISEEKRYEYLQTISVECDRQIDLVLNLLDLSRIEGGVFRLSLQQVNIEELLLSCVKSETIAAEKRGHKLQINSVETIPSLCADPKALRRVVSNLIENSIKYTPDGGVITLSAELLENYVALKVADNGQGIPPEDLPILFDKFHRGRPAPHSAVMRNATTDAEFLEDADVSGVGLGLYLARNVIERMNGKITVDTEVGQGSTFTLYLPVWIGEICGNPVIEEENENGKKIISS